jgi:hypothetical protein
MNTEKILCPLGIYYFFGSFTNSISTMTMYMGTVGSISQLELRFQLILEETVFHYFVLLADYVAAEKGSKKWKKKNQPS